MRKFFTYTDSNIDQLLINRDSLGLRLRSLRNIPPDQAFGLDVFSEDGLLLAYFEYPPIT
jgi:hypothetical protein